MDSDPTAARQQALEILRVEPAQRLAMKLLSAALRRLDRVDEAQLVELDIIKASAQEPALLNAATAISAGKWNEAERELRPYLDRNPGDAAALNLLAKVAAHVGAYRYAEILLREALDLAPAFVAARLQLADVLSQIGDRHAALDVLDQLLAAEPDHLKALIAKATTLGRTGEYQKALAIYEDLVERFPRNPQIQLVFGHLLKTVDRLEEGVSAYRKALEMRQSYGEVWWSLANLKTVTLTHSDREAITAALAADLNDEDRLHLHFALGKALEDAGEFEASFHHYDQGNAIRRRSLPYEHAKIERQVQRSIALFTRDFLAHAEPGCSAPDPIFIIGMPRAGSTLLEQILSSHSAIEGTAELPHIIALSHGLGRSEVLDAAEAYPDALADVRSGGLLSLGEEYLRRAKMHRKTDRPFFVDKQPNNWLHIGFIRLILPNAKIIDARRHPMSCCFSNFKQHFAQGQAFSYCLGDMAHYYRQYVELLCHFDEVMPGHVHRVIHEELIEHPEREVRRLLCYLGLPFEARCLKFYENKRPVWTPSSSQVRQPLNRQGMEQWKPYRQWLRPLEQELGSVLTCYPEAPTGLCRS